MKVLGWIAGVLLVLILVSSAWTTWTVSFSDSGEKMTGVPESLKVEIQQLREELSNSSETSESSSSKTSSSDESSVSFALNWGGNQNQ